MTARVEREFTVNLTADELCDAMRDPVLIEKSEKSRDALEVEVREVTKTDDKHVYEIDVVNYARTVKGIDKNKTEKSTTVVTWDLKTKKRSWTWRGEHAQVKIQGGDDIVESGGGTKLRMRANIDVSIPLAGKLIEKKIASGFEDNWPSYIRLVEQHAKA